MWRTLKPYVKVELLNALNNQKQIGWDTVVTADENGMRVDRFEKLERRATCAMEYIYFARPDSDINGTDLTNADLTDVDLANVTATDGVIYRRHYTVSGSGLVLITVSVEFYDADDPTDVHTAKLQMLRTSQEKL